MKHILIVEDEAHLAIGIKYNLEAEGYLVTTVATVRRHSRSLRIIHKAST